MERDLRNAHDVAKSLAARNLDATKFDLKAIANSAKYMQWLEAEDARLEARCLILRGICLHDKLLIFEQNYLSLVLKCGFVALNCH
jgi:hypothetical protein